jgi:hypothetical protein
LQKPANSGSTFYTYKHTFAIQLLAVVDADYKFIYIDVGCQGRIGDAGVYLNSTLCDALESNCLNLPAPEALRVQNALFPYVFVADDAFPLKMYMMKPYAHRGLDRSERIFNYRLSRARRVVENAFGILASRFRVFRTEIMLQPSKAESVVLAATVLHNFIIQHCCSLYIPGTSLDAEDFDTGNINPADWRAEGGSSGMIDLGACSARTQSLQAKSVRNNFANYFMNEGHVPWQWSFVNN